MDEMFEAFREPGGAVLHNAEGDHPIDVIADFDPDIEIFEGEKLKVGYVGIFDLTASVYNQVKTGDTFTLNGRTFQITEKKPPNSGVYQVVGES